MIFEPIELDGGDGWRMILETEEMLEMVGGVEQMDQTISRCGSEEKEIWRAIENNIGTHRINEKESYPS